MPRVSHSQCRINFNSAFRDFGWLLDYDYYWIKIHQNQASELPSLNTVSGSNKINDHQFRTVNLNIAASCEPPPWWTGLGQVPITRSTLAQTGYELQYSAQFANSKLAFQNNKAESLRTNLLGKLQHTVRRSDYIDPLMISQRSPRLEWHSLCCLLGRRNA